MPPLFKMKAVYGLKDEAATLSWEAKPFKVRPVARGGVWTKLGGRAVREQRQAMQANARTGMRMARANPCCAPPPPPPCRRCCCRRRRCRGSPPAHPQLAVKSKAGRGGVGGFSASLQATKEFEF